MSSNYASNQFRFIRNIHGGVIMIETTLSLSLSTLFIYPLPARMDIDIDIDLHMEQRAEKTGLANRKRRTDSGLLSTKAA